MNVSEKRFYDWMNEIKRGNTAGVAMDISALPREAVPDLMVEMMTALRDQLRRLEHGVERLAGLHERLNRVEGMLRNVQLVERPCTDHLAVVDPANLRIVAGGRVRTSVRCPLCGEKVTISAKED